MFRSIGKTIAETYTEMDLSIHFCNLFEHSHRKISYTSVCTWVCVCLYTWRRVEIFFLFATSLFLRVGIFVNIERDDGRIYDIFVVDDTLYELAQGKIEAKKKRKPSG